MPDKPSKVLIIGSGPIVIGQAAEFDYAGTQACRALREEGIRTILLNSNPATIMTDPGVADAIYLEPLTVASVERILELERPDGILPGIGGQTGLNLVMDVARAGVLERSGTRLLGTPIEAIEMAEDRERFRDLLDTIGQPYAPSVIVEGATAEERAAATQRAFEAIGTPAIVRPAFTLGGTGGGIVGKVTKAGEGSEVEVATTSRDIQAILHARGALDVRAARDAEERRQLAEMQARQQAIREQLQELREQLERPPQPRTERGE